MTTNVKQLTDNFTNSWFTVTAYSDDFETDHEDSEELLLLDEENVICEQSCS